MLPLGYLGLGSLSTSFSPKDPSPETQGPGAPGAPGGHQKQRERETREARLQAHRLVWVIQSHSATSESVFLRVSSIRSCLVALLHLALCDPVDCSPSGSSVHKIFSGKNAGMDCHFFLQGGLPNPEIKPASPVSPALAGRGGGVAVSLPAEPSGKPCLKGRCSFAVCILVSKGLVLQSREMETLDWRPAGRPAIWREQGEEAGRTAWARRTCIQVPS